MPAGPADRGPPPPSQRPPPPARARTTPCDGLGPLLNYRRGARGLEGDWCDEFDRSCATNDRLHLVYYTAQSAATVHRLRGIATAPHLGLLAFAWASVAAITAGPQLGLLPLRWRQPMVAAFRVGAAVTAAAAILPSYMHVLQPLDAPAGLSLRAVMQELYLPTVLCLGMTGMRLPLKYNAAVLAAQLALAAHLGVARCAAELARPGRPGYYQAAWRAAAAAGAALAPAAALPPARPLADAQACHVVKTATLVVLACLPLGALAAAEERWRLEYAADARRNTPIVPSGARLLLSNLALVALAAPVVLRALLLWHGA